VLLLYTTFAPFISKIRRFKPAIPHGSFQEMDLDTVKAANYRKIAIALDFSPADVKTIRYGIAQGGKQAKYLLIHVVETPMAFMFGKETGDFETRTDMMNLQKYADQLEASGYKVECAIGFGRPRNAIAEKTNAFNAELLVLGSHGHHWFKDLFLGTTIEGVRHQVNIPVLVVR
jgi:manganese transport protein